jgi:hypothetical protein
MEVEKRAMIWCRWKRQRRLPYVDEVMGRAGSGNGAGKMEALERGRQWRGSGTKRGERWSWGWGMAAQRRKLRGRIFF